MIPAISRLIGSEEHFEVLRNKALIEIARQLALANLIAIEAAHHRIGPSDTLVDLAEEVGG